MPQFPAMIQERSAPQLPGAGGQYKNMQKMRSDYDYDEVWMSKKR